ncbi:MAG: hypothetical protein WD733_06675, partial [Bryobacterales bacterium]
RGGTWSAAGVILFAPSPSGELHRVAEAGGEPVAVTKTDESVSRRFPWFLPDGRHFLYSDSAAGPDRNGIYLGSLDGSEPRRLLADDSNAVYVEAAGNGSGVMLFSREDTLLAQPFDHQRLELTGDPFPVVESIGRLGNIGHYGFSVSNTDSLLYVRGHDSAGVTQLTWFDRAGKPLLPLGKPAGVIDLALSPDEAKAALAIVSGGEPPDVWVFEFARATMSRVTSRGFRPIWSPDGTRLSFSSQRTGRLGLYQTDVGGAGEDETLLSETDARVTAPAGPLSDWSQDGRFLLYGTVRSAGTRQDLWILPLEGDRKPFAYLATEFEEAAGRFAPDGRWVAYQSDESGRTEVYVRPFPAADRKWQISTEGGSLPVWSKDGRELYYLAPDRTLMAVALKAGETMEAGIPQALFPTRMPDFGFGLARLYDVSRDGRFLMAARTDQAAQGEQTENRSVVMLLNWWAKLGRR